MQIGDLEDIYPTGVGDTARQYRALEADVVWTLFKFGIRGADYKVSALLRAAVVGRNLAAAATPSWRIIVRLFSELRAPIDTGQAKWRAVCVNSIQTET